MQEQIPDPFKLERTAPSCGELMGHRAWLLWNREELNSVGVWPFAWKPGVPVRDCDKDGQFVGDWNSVGVWSFKSPLGPVEEYLLEGGSGSYVRDTLMHDAMLESVDIKLVIGTCWMWGTVIEHERGYRAQFGAVRSLDGIYEFFHPSRHWYKCEDSQLMEIIRTRYGVLDAGGPNVA